MLSRDSGHAAERLDRCLSGDAVPHDADTRNAVTLARLLMPKRPISQAARDHAFEAMMREADRVGRTPSNTEAAPADVVDPGVNIRTASAGHGLTLRVADIEHVDDARMEEIAARVAERLGQRAPDRNP
jgi:hypothetical protein